MDLFADEWLYVTGYEVWYKWAGTHWAKDESLRIQKQIQALMDAMNKAARDGMLDAYADLKNATTPEDEKRLLKAIEVYKGYIGATKRTKGRVVSVESMAQAQRVP